MNLGFWASGAVALVVTALAAPPETRRGDPVGYALGVVIVGVGGLLVASWLIASAWPAMMHRCFLGLGGC